MPPSGLRASSSRDDPSSTRRHHIGSAPRQVSRHSSQSAKIQPACSSRGVEPDQQQHRLETQPPPTTQSPPRRGYSNSSPTAAYPSSSSGANTRGRTPPQDSSLYRSSSRRNTQKHTLSSESSPRRSSSRNSAQEYAPPSDDQRRPSTLSRVHTPDDWSRREWKRVREREKKKERRNASDSDESEAFSRLGDLRPTFSPAIIRTPEFYERKHSQYPSLSKADGKYRLLSRTDTLISPTRYDERPQPPTHYTSSSFWSVQQPSRSVAHSQTYQSLDAVFENPYSSVRRDSRDVRESGNPLISIPHSSDAVMDLARPNRRTLGRSHARPEHSHNPTRAVSLTRAPSPPRALSPLRSSTPHRSSSRTPSHSHILTSSGEAVPSVPVPPLPTDASYRYETSSSASRNEQPSQFPSYPIYTQSPHYQGQAFA
jgi:hypothetical protein